MFLAGVAHPVERHLAKVEVASSSLVTRSIKKRPHESVVFFYGKRYEARTIYMQQSGGLLLAAGLDGGNSFISIPNGMEM